MINPPLMIGPGLVVTVKAAEGAELLRVKADAVSCSDLMAHDVAWVLRTLVTCPPGEGAVFLLAVRLPAPPEGDDL